MNNEITMEDIRKAISQIQQPPIKIHEMKDYNKFLVDYAKVLGLDIKHDVNNIITEFEGIPIIIDKEGLNDSKP